MKLTTSLTEGFQQNIENNTFCLYTGYNFFLPISLSQTLEKSHMRVKAKIENEIHVICPSKKKFEKKYYSPLTFTCLKHCLSHVNPLAMLLPEQITEVSELHKRLRT